MATHPPNAAYISADSKVSFDRYGRKLDSGGRVVWGDRQRAGDAGARPIQRREESQSQAQQGSAAIARNNFPANATGQAQSGPMLEARYIPRSSWDNSPVQPVSGAASAAGGVAARRGNNPNVLAPGGIDTTTGQAYPTARNGGWRGPAASYAFPAGATGQPARSWRGYPADSVDNFNTSMGSGGQVQSYVPPAVDMPYPPTGNSLENFMSGNSQWSPVQPKVNVPGFGQLPASIQMQTGGLNVMPDYANIPARNMPYPPTGASYGNQYIPETYSRQTVPVYDPNQLSWVVP